METWGGLSGRSRPPGRLGAPTGIRQAGPGGSARLRGRPTFTGKRTQVSSTAGGQWVTVPSGPPALASYVCLWSVSIQGWWDAGAAKISKTGC